MTSRKSEKISPLLALAAALEAHVPQFFAWSCDEDDFRELRIKLKPDGTMLVVAKGTFADGGPSVCFGVGYGVVGALLAVNATITSGNWRKDKPWPNKGD